MQNCPQTPTQSVYQHGLSVRDCTFALIKLLKEYESYSDDDWKLPGWFFQYRHQILQHLLPNSIIEEYTIFHDCGKPYCLIYDEQGKKHFPNHAQVSSQTWLASGGNAQCAKLMSMDMMIHTMKANDIPEFIQHPEAITLLMVGLAEIHANAKTFGGFDSTSFKIKWNQINKRGNAICRLLFQE
jgi:hypothetical protein